MTEERKHKKLNFKKIAIVALSIIMIMTMFCLSAFADNPLTENGNITATFYGQEAHNALIIPIGRFEENQNEIEPTIYKITVYNEEDKIVLRAHDMQGKKAEINSDNGLYLNVNWIDRYNFTKLVVEYNTNDLNFVQEYISAQINGCNIDSLESALEIFSNTTFSYDVGILSTFLGVGSWLSGAITALIGLFWLNGSLTFIGILTVGALAIGVIFLIIRLIQNFLHFKG